jgi:hypothetical protein
MEHVPTHRAHCNPSTFADPYAFNYRFKFSQSSIAKGFVVNNEPIFPKSHSDDALSREYRTIFGPCFQGNFNMVWCDNDGIRGAVRRLTASRNPLDPVLETLLWENQSKFKEFLGGGFDHWFDYMSHQIRTHVRDLPDAPVLRQEWCEEPHIKRLLRFRARQGLITTGSWPRTRVKIVDYKCKPGELLGRGKYARAVGDLTTPGSTVCGYLMPYIKDAFAEEYLIPDLSLKFVKTPDVQLLAEEFNRVLHPRGICFRYFSDDGMVGVECSDGILTANSDISKCDGSNGPEILQLTYHLMRADPRYADDALDVYEQLFLPAKIQSDDKKFKVTMKPLYGALYSGSTNTTTQNNVVNSLIALSIAKAYTSYKNANRHLPTKREAISMCENAAKNIGFILKLNVCNVPEDLQFLKHSPGIVCGTVVPYLNLGVWLRGFGTIRGDLPGLSKVGLHQRAKMQNSDTVKSRVHAGNHCIHDAFKQHIISESHGLPTESSLSHTLSTNGVDTYIPVDTIARRYGLRPEQIEELAYTIANSSLEQRYASDVLDKIYAKDYGV